MPLWGIVCLYTEHIAHRTVLVVVFLLPETGSLKVCIEKDFLFVVDSLTFISTEFIITVALSRCEYYSFQDFAFETIVTLLMSDARGNSHLFL